MFGMWGHLQWDRHELGGLRLVPELGEDGGQCVGEAGISQMPSSSQQQAATTHPKRMTLIEP